MVIQPGRMIWGAALFVLGGMALAGAGGRGPGFGSVQAGYIRDARPLLKQYCLGCHSTAARAGSLDLERLATLDDVRRQPEVWQRVAEVLTAGEMPPAGAKQPSAQQRLALLGWVRRYLRAEARATAGDPGPVILRRLNNAEYAYTVRDLTGVDLDPTREFPSDGAAGEGFTNTGGSLVMSPDLLAKYLDAGKEIAKHAELLSDGFRFSRHSSRSDWTNEALDRIRSLYRRYTDAGGASPVNLQGIVFDTNAGGRLPVERYLAATLAERENLRAGRKTVPQVARSRRLSAKYLGLLWAMLNDRRPSPLFDPLRAQWRAAKPSGARALAAGCLRVAEAIGEWQKALWRFTTVGHIGREGGPTAWQEPVVPVAARQEVRLKLPPANGREVTVYLTVRDAGDGNAADFALWERPRLVWPGRPDLLLRDVRASSLALGDRRKRLFGSAAKALAAASAAVSADSRIDVARLAREHGLDAETLAAWLGYLGVGPGAPVRLDHFGSKQTSVGGYAFVNGWGSPELPSLVANTSDQHVRIPGNMKPRGVCVHPTPALSACVGWQSPVAGMVRIEGKVTHAHPECGNGVTWSLELRRGATRRQLAAGSAQGASAATLVPTAPLQVAPGDLVSLVIGPRDGNHACDLTDLELILKHDDGRDWSLTRDVAGDVLAGNPHADRFGNPAVWHFYSQPVTGGEAWPGIPPGSLLARWEAASTAAEKQRLAEALQSLLTSGPTAGADEKHPDVVLYRQLSLPGGPLLQGSGVRGQGSGSNSNSNSNSNSIRSEPRTPSPDPFLGPDPALFGKHPAGAVVEPASLCVRAPSVVEIRVPAELAAGAELVTTASLHPQSGARGSVQMQAVLQGSGFGVQGSGSHRPRTRRRVPTIVGDRTRSELTPDPCPLTPALVPGTPVLVGKQGSARQRFARAFDDFRALFPVALAYTKIVPVDEVVTLTLFHREDEPLRRLMLTGSEARRLDRLWSQLHFVSQSPLKLVTAYEQIVEFATQDRPDLVKAFKPLKKPIEDGAAAFEKALLAAEPRQLDRLVAFAARAYRRPLTAAEAAELRALYRRLRETEELPHEEAFRLTLARVFVAPAFLYRLEAAPSLRPHFHTSTRPHAGPSAPVSDWELASRLSYFLWSSQPDAALRAAAASGNLRRPEVLAAQTRRMLADPKVRRLATEFAGQWLHIYQFDTLDEKSEKHFPEFAGLRRDMYEEAIRFFADLFQRGGSVLSLFDADHTFVNERLARFYGIPGMRGGEWRRVDGLRRIGRGGLLGLAATLAKQSGASRTSPVLRGTWVSEVLLGEKLPRPPKDVPRLPEDETATEGLTVRQLVARHTSDPACSGCHRRIDPFGFALEGFDAIGRRRATDLGNRPVDTKTRTPDGKAIDGLAGLRDYLLRTRREDLLRQFCRKLLGYSLGRAVQLSDEPLLAEMQARLARKGYRFSTAVQWIVQSRQFQEIRARS